MKIRDFVSNSLTEYNKRAKSIFASSEFVNSLDEKVNGKVNADGITTIKKISQADYNNLQSYDSATLYVIV